MSWQPLFSEKEERDELSVVVSSITNDLLQSKNGASDLFGGRSGMSIFWYYLSELESNREHRRRGSELLESCLASLEATTHGHTYSTGIAGILWSVCHLNDRRASPINIQELIGDEIDSFLVNRMKEDFRKGNCDYLHGAPGMALYFLERQDYPKYNQVLEEIFSGIEANSVELPNGIAWRDYFDEKATTYNLGLAHGAPSLIVILSRIMQSSPGTKRVYSLLEKSVNWVLSMKAANNAPWLFPTTFPWGETRSSRLSWCYGDLGVAMAIFQAGMIADNPLWRSEAIEIAIHATRKKSFIECGVVDSCLCHGTAGNAHIFNRLYQYTGNSELRAASKYWYRQTLNLFNSPVGLKTWRWNEEKADKKWIESHGLLEGITGVGLTLISAISRIEPKWDRCLLLS